MKSVDIKVWHYPKNLLFGNDWVKRSNASSELMDPVDDPVYFEGVCHIRNHIYLMFIHGVEL